MTIKAARAVITEWHRHHRAPQGALFAVGCEDGEGTLHGVATIGRPVARRFDDGYTCEVTRLCTDGTRNACSLLYGAAARAAAALGYRDIITYTLPEEGGASLRAAGWEFDGDTGGGAWSRVSRERVDDHPTGVKHRWRKRLVAA